jgi:hypothetical protein
MKRLFIVLAMIVDAAILFVWLVLGVFGRARDIIYGTGQNPLFPPFDNLLFLSLLPIGIAIIWILRSFNYRYIPLKLMLCACLVVSFGFALPEAAALLHPLARTEFRDHLDAACMNIPVPQAAPYVHGRVGPNRIAPAGELLTFYSQLPDRWRSHAIDETQLVLCSDGIQEFVIAEHTYDLPYMPDGLHAKRVQYIENFRLVAAGTGETISHYTAYGSYPPDFPEVLHPPFEFFRAPDLIIVIHGDQDTRRWLPYWLYRYINPGPRIPSSVF